MTVTGWASLTESVRAELSPGASGPGGGGPGRPRGRAERSRAAGGAGGPVGKRAVRYAQLGVQPGQVLADAMRGMNEDGEYEAARAVMERIERRRESRRKTAEFQAEQLAAVSRASGEPAGIERVVTAAARPGHGGDRPAGGSGTPRQP
jgi:hypothetical protein